MTVTYILIKIFRNKLNNKNIEQHAQNIMNIKEVQKLKVIILDSKRKEKNFGDEK